MELPMLPNKPKTCDHGYIVDDPNPQQLCPFCPQPNRIQIAKAWDKLMGTKFAAEYERGGN